MEEILKNYIGSLLLVSAFLVSVASHAAVVKTPLSSVETLDYQIITLNNEVGTLSLRVDKTSGVVSKMQGEVVTTGALDKFYPVRNRQVTYVEKSGTPSKTLQKRSGKSGITNLNIRYKRHEVLVFQEKGGKETNKVRKHPSPVQDVLTSLLLLKDWDFKKRSVITFTMFSGKQFFKVKATVAGLEEIWTPLRKVEDAQRIDIVIERIGGKKRKKVKTSMWVDPDNPKYPLKATYRTKYVGDVVVLLKSRSFETLQNRSKTKKSRVKKG